MSSFVTDNDIYYTLIFRLRQQLISVFLKKIFNAYFMNNNFLSYNMKKKFKLYYFTLKIIALLNNCKKIKKDIDFLIFTDIIKAIINSVDYLDGSR